MTPLTFPIPQRELGASGVKASAIGLGCWGMSGPYGAVDLVEAEATLHHALDCGVNFFDTADSYGAGGNEALIGRILRDRRHEIVLASKAGFVDRIGSDGRKTTSVDGSPRHLRTACDESLARLGTDVIDLYYLHRLDPVTPIEESVGALAELVRAGKVRWIGLSEVGPATLRRAHAIHPITALQSEYSLWTRDVEAKMLPLCKEFNVSLVAFSPLGRGFLTGMNRREVIGSDDFRSTNPRFSQENWDQNQQLLRSIRAIAEHRGCEISQIALAWLLSRGEKVIPIPGTKQRRHVDVNIAANGVQLSTDELAVLDVAFPKDVAAGSRYNPDQARWIDD